MWFLQPTAYTRPARRSVWCWQLRKYFALHASRMEFNTQNEEWISVLAIICIILPLCFVHKSWVIKVYDNNGKNPWFQTFAVFCMLYVFFWVIPRRLNFLCRRFGTLCLFHLYRQVGVHLPAYEDGTDRVFRNYPELHRRKHTTMGEMCYKM